MCVAAWQRASVAWSGQHQHLINLRYFQFSVLIDQINKLCFLGWPQWPGNTRSAHGAAMIDVVSAPALVRVVARVRSHVDKQFHQFYKQLNSVTWVRSLHLSMATAAGMWCNLTRAVNENKTFTIVGEGLYWNKEVCPQFYIDMDLGKLGASKWFLEYCENLAESRCHLVSSVL